MSGNPAAFNTMLSNMCHGGKLRGVIYKLDVPEFKPGATYTLQARIKSSGGTNSTRKIGLR
jgi:hypothetical protein